MGFFNTYSVEYQIKSYRNQINKYAFSLSCRGFTWFYFLLSKLTPVLLPGGCNCCRVLLTECCLDNACSVGHVRFQGERAVSAHECHHPVECCWGLRQAKTFSTTSEPFVRTVTALSLLTCQASCRSTLNRNIPLCNITLRFYLREWPWCH